MEDELIIKIIISCSKICKEWQHTSCLKFTEEEEERPTPWREANVGERGHISRFQSEFRKGRGTMDPMTCLEHEIRKAHINKEALFAVFFDVVKAYDMMWKEGLLIKLKKMGVGGRIFNWIKDFMGGMEIQVRIGRKMSRQYVVKNGTPQGIVISRLIFSIIINDIFSEINPDIGRSLFADNGALWKRERTLVHINERIQETINTVEQWAN